MPKKMFRYVKLRFSIAVLLFLVLGIHIYMVTRHLQNTELHQQLSRIDVKQPVVSLEAAK
jgi:hypothetical protein